MTALYGTVFLTAFLSNHISTVFRSMTCRTTWIARDRPLPIAALPPAASKERSLRTVPCVIQTFQIVDWISACSHTRACRTSGSLTARSIRAALRFRSSKALLFWIAAWNRSIWETVRWTAVRLATSTITQGGVTQEECERLREQTYRALGVELPERSCAKRSIGRERGSR